MSIFSYADRLEVAARASPRALYLYVSGLAVAGLDLVDTLLDAQNYYAGEPSKLAMADILRLSRAMRPSFVFILMSIFWAGMFAGFLWKAESVFRRITK